MNVLQTLRRRNGLGHTRSTWNRRDPRRRFVRENRIAFEQFESRHVLASVTTDGPFLIHLENVPGDVNGFDGNLSIQQSGLVYNSRTLADAVIQFEVPLPLMNDGSTPTSASAVLAFNGEQKPRVYWNIDPLALPGEKVLFRFAVSDPPGTGRYPWSVAVTYSREGATDPPVNYPSSGSNQFFYVDRTASAFGKGWHPEDLHQLRIYDPAGDDSYVGQIYLITGYGEHTRFDWDPLTSSYRREPGDPYFFKLTRSASTPRTYTLTAKDGTELKFVDRGPTPNVAARLESLYDSSGNERRFTYENTTDNSAKLTSIQDIPTGNTTTFAYPGGSFTSITDFASRVTTFSFTSGQLTSVTLPDPDDFTSTGGTNGPLVAPVWEYAYSGMSGLLVKSINPIGNTSEFAYGGPGPTNETVVAIQQRGDTSYLTPYNSLGNGGTLSIPGILRTASHWESVAWFTDERANSTRFRVNHLGFGTWIMDDDGTWVHYLRDPDEGSILVRYEPDPDGAPNPLTELHTFYGYDARGNMTSEVKKSPVSDSILAFQQWSYDDPDYSLPTKHTDELGRVTKWTIGPKSGPAENRGKILSMTEIVGLEDSPSNGESNDLKTTYTYTTVAGHFGLLNTITDPIGRVTKYDYWTTSPHKGLLKRITFNYGAQQTTNVEYEYDPFRNLSATLDELDRRTDFGYDKLNRLIKRTDPDPDAGGPLLRPETEFAYDPAGNLIKTIDPLDNVTSAIYDSRNRVVHAIPPRPESTAPSVNFADDYPLNTSSFEKSGTWTRMALS